MALTTTCGFLSLHQRTLSQALPVPIATSSLVQVPSICAMLRPGEQLGIITFDRSQLTPAHFSALGLPDTYPVEGMDPAASFHRWVRSGIHVSDEHLWHEVRDAARRLVDRCPEVGAFVLECANMPPFSRRLAEEFGVPIFDAVTLVGWLWEALNPPSYAVSA
jgi:hypothetical protein